MTYTVHVTGEDGTWLADVPAVAGAVRRGREEMVRREAELVSATGRLAVALLRTYSVRDTAAMRGVTAGRVSQLTNR